MEKLLEYNRDLLREDLAICLDGERFSSGIERNHLHESSQKWELNRAIHQELANSFGWEIVNANQSRGDVANEILRIVANRFLI